MNQPTDETGHSIQRSAEKALELGMYGLWAQILVTEAVYQGLFGAQDVDPKPAPRPWWKFWRTK